MPDLAASPYLTSNKPPPPVLSLGNVVVERVAPAPSRATTVAVVEDGELAQFANVDCAGRIGRVAVAATPSFADGIATCTWILGRKLHGTLRGVIGVSAHGLRRTQTFATSIR